MRERELDCRKYHPFSRVPLPLPLNIFVGGQGEGRGPLLLHHDRRLRRLRPHPRPHAVGPHTGGLGRASGCRAQRHEVPRPRHVGDARGTRDLRIESIILSLMVQSGRYSVTLQNNKMENAMKFLRGSPPSGMAWGGGGLFLCTWTRLPGIWSSGTPLAEPTGGRAGTGPPNVSRKVSLYQVRHSPRTFSGRSHARISSLNTSPTVQPLRRASIPSMQM